MSKNNNNPLPQVNSLTRIAESTKVLGDITTASDIRIDGCLIGDLTTLGKLVLGANGTIEGNVICREADIYGKCSGDIIGQNTVTLKSTAVFTGSLKTAHIGIETGASFSGNCALISNSE